METREIGTPEATFVARGYSSSAAAVGGVVVPAADCVAVVGNLQSSGIGS